MSTGHRADDLQNVGSRSIRAFETGGASRLGLSEIDAWIKAQIHDVRQDKGGDGR